MFVRACVRMRVGACGAGLNVSRQSLLISAEAVAEALSRQGCILRREGLPFERQGWFINSPNLWPASLCHTHKHKHTSAHTHEPKWQRALSLYIARRKEKGELLWWMLQRQQSSKRWYTTKHGDAFVQGREGGGNDLIMREREREREGERLGRALSPRGG